jgi:hypothetical protein
VDTLQIAEFTPWLVSCWLIAKGRVTLVNASIAATPVARTPFMVSKRPETTSWVLPLVRTIERTSLVSVLLPSVLPAVVP